MIVKHQDVSGYDVIEVTGKMPDYNEYGLFDTTSMLGLIIIGGLILYLIRSK